MKCIGNCALCELTVDKSACCAVQTLKNIIEVKTLMADIKSLLSADNSPFASLPDIESTDSEPTPLGTEKNDEREDKKE